MDSSFTSGYEFEEEYIHLDGWRPIASIRPHATTGMNSPQIYPILSDHLGTPRKVLDGNSGEVRWSWDAKEPFGDEAPNETPTAGLNTFGLDLRFPGQRYDAETGLFQNGFRDYHPGLGRYIESDPIGLLGGLNTYVYGLNSPLMNTDSSGLVIDGKAFNVPEFREALAYLSQSPSGREIIQQVVDAKQVMTLSINSNKKTYFRDFIEGNKFQRGEVVWDPYMGIYDESSENSCSSGPSPAMNLLHEMIHFNQALQDPIKYQKMYNMSREKGVPYSREYYSQLENDAVVKERKVAKELGEMQRPLYNNPYYKTARYRSVTAKRPFIIVVP